MKPGHLMVDVDGREVSVGAITLLVIVGILTVLLVGRDEAQTSGETGLYLWADFNRIDGLTVDSPVRMAGVTVGRVASFSLGEEGQATVSIEITDAGLPVPTDTAAVIETDGIFGEKYIELHPGGEFDVLKSGQKFSYTQDSVVLETLLNQVVARAKAAQEAEVKE